MSRVVLATASWCKNCEPVKKYIEDNNMEVSMFDVDTNLDEARDLGIRGIPCLLVENKVHAVGSSNIIYSLEEDGLWD